MNRIHAMGLALTLVLGGVSQAGQAGVSASAAWVQGPAEAGATASAFVVIENPTMYEVYVVSVAAAATAGAAEIVRGADGAAAVPELAVPAYGQVELKPGDLHIRLKDLKQPLKAGDEVELTLTTDGGVTVTVSATVKG